jgi:hypothetical protein
MRNEILAKNMRFTILMVKIYGETLLQTLQGIQRLDYVLFKSALLFQFVFHRRDTVRRSQHAQFTLTDNVDINVKEITAALGCKFVYFTELRIIFFQFEYLCYVWSL